MNKLTQALMEELTVEYVKVGPLQIPESVVISWVILAIVTISCGSGTRVSLIVSPNC